MKTVRSKVVVSVYNSNEVLLSEVYDPGRDVTLYLPVGGGVEFQEYLEEAAARELKEEIGLESKLVFDRFSENHFEFDGTPAHEIVFHFHTEIDDDTRVALPDHGVESDGVPFPIKWHKLETLRAIKAQIVPMGLFDDIERRLKPSEADTT